jgi:hypothetical protein
MRLLIPPFVGLAAFLLALLLLAAWTSTWGTRLGWVSAWISLGTALVIVGRLLSWAVTGAT